MYIKLWVRKVNTSFFLIFFKWLILTRSYSVGLPFLTCRTNRLTCLDSRKSIEKMRKKLTLDQSKSIIMRAQSNSFQYAEGWWRFIGYSVARLVPVPLNSFPWYTTWFSCNKIWLYYSKKNCDIPTHFSLPVVRLWIPGAQFTFFKNCHLQLFSRNTLWTFWLILEWKPSLKKG